VAVRDDDRVRLRRLHGKPRRVAGQHPEVEKERIVHEHGAPADLASAAEKPDLHRPSLLAVRAWARRFGRDSAAAPGAARENGAWPLRRHDRVGGRGDGGGRQCYDERQQDGAYRVSHER
jgi:hypothetical protein